MPNFRNTCKGHINRACNSWVVELMRSVSKFQIQLICLVMTLRSLKGLASEMGWLRELLWQMGLEVHNVFSIAFGVEFVLIEKVIALVEKMLGAGGLDMVDDAPVPRAGGVEAEMCAARGEAALAYDCSSDYHSKQGPCCGTGRQGQAST